jgi:adenylate cyclase
MKITASHIRTLTIALWIIGGYVVISALFSLNVHAVRYAYAFAQYNFELQQYVENPSSVTESLKRSTPIGLLLGMITAIIELAILPVFVRRMKFLVSVVIRIAGYVIITIPVVYYGILLEEMFYRGVSYATIASDPGFAIVGPRIAQLVAVISTLSALFISFIRLVGKKFGQGVLLQYVMGKYHTPREEERIFMFMDLRSSTRIAEQLDHKQYHNFLNDIFHDISEPIFEYRGEIYQYVGDEVVITWPIEAGIEQERCIRCFFAINALLERRNRFYLQRYGVEAKMKAGIHCGVVTTGEIGDLKTEIVFHGDAVNTTSRIQEMCNELRTSLLVSGELLQRCSLSDKFVLEGGGTLKLRGKEKVIEVYSLIRKSSEA